MGDRDWRGGEVAGERGRRQWDSARQGQWDGRAARRMGENDSGRDAGLQAMWQWTGAV